MRKPILHQRQKLVDYLCRWASDAGRSTLGPQLDRMALFSFGSTPCLACGGDRATGRPGCGFVVGDPKLRRKGTRRPVSDAARLFLAHAGIDPDTLAPQADTPCPKCGGFGFLPRRSKCRPRGPVTARPTGSSLPTERGGYVLNEGAVKLCGSVGRWLAEVYANDPDAATTIEVFITHGETRVPLWLCTDPGRRLLHRSELGRRALERRDLDAALRTLDNERAAQELAPNAQRGELLRAADREALAMLERAAGLWNRVVPTEDEQAEQEYLRAVGL
jgi:hypothetical protein